MAGKIQYMEWFAAKIRNRFSIRKTIVDNYITFNGAAISRDN